MFVSQVYLNSVSQRKLWIWARCKHIIIPLCGTRCIFKKLIPQILSSPSGFWLFVEQVFFSCLFAWCFFQWGWGGSRAEVACLWVFLVRCFGVGWLGGLVLVGLVWSPPHPSPPFWSIVNLAGLFFVHVLTEERHPELSEWSLLSPRILAVENGLPWMQNALFRRKSL